MPARRSGHVASCVAIGNRALLIEGPPGSGKSSLALMLIDRGARLIGDDSVLLEAIEDRLVARPHPNTGGLLEVRNLGLVEMPVCEGAAVSLVLRLDNSAPRYIEQAETLSIEGIALPMLRLWPDTLALAIKAELALERFGLAWD
jgi:serine kinase of HPr protein (carbohydrate metabolism regulator)